MLKRLKYSSNHAVLEKMRPLKPGDLTHVGDRHPKLLGPPPNLLPGADDTGGHTANRSNIVRPRRFQFEAMLNDSSKHASMGASITVTNSMTVMRAGGQ